MEHGAGTAEDVLLHSVRKLLNCNLLVIYVVDSHYSVNA